MSDLAKLTTAQEKAVADHLTETFTNPCAVCGERHWLIFPTMLGEEFYDAGGLYMTSAHLGPKVRITCRNCGNILYFSAERLGLLNNEPSQDG